MVEHRGFEPLTPTLPVSCAPNCANAPRLDYFIIRPRSLSTGFLIGLFAGYLRLFACFRERHVKNVVDPTKSGHVGIKIRTMLMLVAGLVCIQAGVRNRQLPKSVPGVARGMHPKSAIAESGTRVSGADKNTGAPCDATASGVFR